MALDDLGENAKEQHKKEKTQEKKEEYGLQDADLEQIEDLEQAVVRMRKEYVAIHSKIEDFEERLDELETMIVRLSNQLEEEDNSTSWQ